MQKLVRLWKRPSRDGRRFSYVLINKDECGKTRYVSLGHADGSKAKRQRDQKERELRMGYSEPGCMRLSKLLEDTLIRTRGHVTESTLEEYGTAMRHFISVVGDIDCRKICHKHGEQFVQACLDGGNRPATARKKIIALNRLFNLAVQRSQLEENPFRYVRKPKVSEGEIHVYSDEECDRMVRAARDIRIGAPFRWDILILTGLCTGMRRGELLNTTWRDIDFAGQTIRVSPKEDTEDTWQWRIKNTDRCVFILLPFIKVLTIFQKRSVFKVFPFFIIFINRRFKQVFVTSVCMPFKQAFFVPFSDCLIVNIQ